MNRLIELWMEETGMHESETQEMPYFSDQMIDFTKWYLTIKKPEIELREANRHAIASTQWTMTRINELNRQIDEIHKKINHEHQTTD